MLLVKYKCIIYIQGMTSMATQVMVAVKTTWVGTIYAFYQTAT